MECKNKMQLQLFIILSYTESSMMYIFTPQVNNYYPVNFA